MSGVEVESVEELDPSFRHYMIEGCIPYITKFRAENGLLYYQQVWAKDELDAYKQLTSGNFSELNKRMMDVEEHRRRTND